MGALRTRPPHCCSRSHNSAVHRGAIRERATPTRIAEMLAAFSGRYSNQETLRGRDVLHCVDNQAAFASLVSGSSLQLDVGAFAALHTLYAVKNGMGLGFEYVESTYNISDGPSREPMAWLLSTAANTLHAHMV